ncbi:MAG: hypothetical protein ACKVOB_03105 [Sphingomonas sp.]
MRQITNLHVTIGGAEILKGRSRIVNAGAVQKLPGASLLGSAGQ